LRQEILVRLDLAGAQELFNLLGDCLADAGNGLQPSLPADLFHILFHGLDGPSRFAECNYLETILGMQLQQFRHLVENCCNVLIFHEIDPAFLKQEHFGQRA
jgi:predicted component of type VI protein secretion system